MVQQIQALVASIRAEDNMHTVQTHVSAISSVVANVVSATEHLMRERSGDIALRQASEPVIAALDQFRGRLTATASEGEDATTPEQLREITRQTKDLVQRLEATSVVADEEDDFR